jgi:hypothetical protein
MVKKNVSAGRAERSVKGKSVKLLVDKELARKGTPLIKEAELLKKALQQGEGDRALELIRNIEAISNIAKKSTRRIQNKICRSAACSSGSDLVLPHGRVLVSLPRTQKV